MIDDTLLDAEERMDKALSVAREDLGSVRTGRAAPSMFNKIMVEYYGAFTPVLISPDGVPLDMGRTRRVVPPHLRRAVDVRDRGCIFAGCHAPTHWCDVHHVREWLADHGETSLENSALLCERHHTKVHHGYRVRRDPAGRWHTYRPDGTEILIPVRLE